MNQRIRSSSTSEVETEYFDLIPVDLFISNILSRLPLECIAQCRCVSKLWSSIIRRPNYNVLFPCKSPAQPRILFIIEYEGDLFFYSVQQPQNPDENTSLVATFHHRTRGSPCSSVCHPQAGGLVCHQHAGKKSPKVAVICNPITREFLALPKSEWRPSNVYDKDFFGYDPIDQQSSDAQRHKWSKHIYQMFHPVLHDDITLLRVAGMIGTCEIVLCPCYTQGPFFIFYYNLETNILTSVNIEVSLWLSRRWVYAFTNYVEDMKLM
ncbi:putative F-box protein At1g61060 [Capsella rubella]|uniref:putative F-box protein At1g61060 n=1 Tax=Capsella rubella TaxID=81985 RepID=UPI000CD49EC5|nr:putative F-box protein At1g61060 [Capsella rubella]